MPSGRGATTGPALAVHVTDADGNAVAGANVAFAVPGSGASANLSATSATTDSDGNASVTATANAIAGGYSVSASIDGSTQTAFVLTNVPGPAAMIVITGGTPQSAVVNRAFAMPLAVRVTDAEGNAVAGASVTFEPPANGASAVLSSTAVSTDANGDASVTATANAVVGAYSVTAMVGGVGTPVTFMLTNTIDAAEVIFANGFD